MLNDRATVIIPCFNVEDYIEECLDSVRAQGPVVHAVHCVDNGSTDGTMAAIERWAKAHPDVRLFLEQEPQRGASAARNRPLARVETEWVQYLDSDDLLLPGKVQEQVEQGKGADVLYERAIFRSVDGAEFEKAPDGNVETGLMAGNLGNTCANLWRTSKLREVDGWDPALRSSQEYDLMLRLYEAEATFKELDGCRTVVRERAAGQISQGAAGQRWRNLVDVQVRMLRAFRRRAVHPDRLNSVRQAFFGGLRMLYPHDPAHAVELWQRYLEPAGFLPTPGGLNTKGYLWAYRLLGFPGAERVKAMLKRTRREQ